jgi:spore maturation protein CgeB
MYSGYLESFYRRFPKTNMLSYEDHYNLLMDDTTEFAGSYTRNFRKSGIDAKCIIANDSVLQCKWRSENKIGSEKKSDILFEQTKSFKPDILWIENLGYINTDWFRNIRDKIKSIRCIVAYHCAPYTKNVLEKLKNADFVITCTPGLKQDLENAGIRSYLVYHGFDKDLLPRLNKMVDAPREYLVFSGSLITGGSFHNSRISLIEKILTENINISLYVTLEKEYKIKAKQLLFLLNSLSKKLGIENFTNKIPFFEYGRSPVKNYSRILLSSNHEPLFGIEMYNLFNISKIVLNIHIGIAGSSAGNMRLFEVTGIGSCLLTDNKENMKDLFDVGNEIVVYDSHEDCINKVRWLMENENERKKIAMAGQKRTLEFHTVEERCKSIIDIINRELLSEPSF